MATKKLAAKKTDKEVKPKKEFKLDIASMFSDTMDVIAKRQGFESSSLEVTPPMSTGMLAIDLITGGGIRPSMVTGAGGEQSAKTTLALTIMGAAIKANIPIIGFMDFEGCFVSETKLGYSRGKEAPLSELFDLSDVDNWEPGTWQHQSRTDIDTVELGHTGSPTGVRTADLYYRGKMPTSKVTLEGGKEFIGYAHPFFVIGSDGLVTQKNLESLLPGDTVLVKDIT